MIYIPCPLCTSNEYSPFLSLLDHYSGERFSVVRCNSCSHRYLNPAPAADQLEPYYSSNASGDSMRKPPNKLFQNLQRISFLRETSQLRSLTGKEGGIVDLGAGDGALVRCLDQEGYKVGGCDFYSKSLWPHRSIPYTSLDLHGDGFNAESICALLHKVPSAVVMRHVFEHLHQPLTVLKKLKSAGVNYIFIIVPNCDSLLSRVFGASWYYWDPPRHLQFYNGKLLNKFLSSAGYTVLSSGTFGLDEFVTTLHRCTRLKALSSNSAGLRSISHLTRPKGMLAGVASALQAPFSHAVCWSLGSIMPT